MTDLKFEKQFTSSQEPIDTEKNITKRFMKIGNLTLIDKQEMLRILICFGVPVQDFDE